MVGWISDTFNIFHSSFLCRRLSSLAGNGLCLTLDCETLPEHLASWAGVPNHSRPAFADNNTDARGLFSAWWLTIKGAHYASGQIKDQVSKQTLVEFVSTWQFCDQFSLLLAILDKRLVHPTGHMAPFTRNQSPLQWKELWVMAAAWEKQKDK